MLVLKFEADIPVKDVPAVKENLAMYLEQWGRKIRLVDVREEKKEPEPIQEQLRLYQKKQWGKHR